MAIAHVELELAPEAAHPFGDRDHVYDLYLPILADGRIDKDQAGRCDGRCRFRCRRPGGCEIRGAIHLDPRGELHLDCGDRGMGGTIALPSGRCPFQAGQMLPIREGDGSPRQFQVLWIRQE